MVIATGTPSGVGMATGQFLQAGDVITCRIEKIGELTNRLSAPPPAAGVLPPVRRLSGGRTEGDEALGDAFRTALAIRPHTGMLVVWKKRQKRPRAWRTDRRRTNSTP